MPVKINDYISYIPATEVPVSGDVGIIYGKKATYLYDVGSTIECLDFLYSLNGKMQIVISHFHGDHTWWLTKHYKGDEGVRPDDEISISYEPVRYERLFIGKSTEKYLPAGEIITEPLVIEDETLTGEPLKLEIIPMPSSHCKGSLALSVNDEYLFMGDSTYCRYIAPKEGVEAHVEYNVQKLKEQIDTLKNIKAERCLVSHEKRFERPKKVVIRQLESIYARRVPGENTIKLTK
ncbi:MAG: MBL fold metallo-hydrolase [Lachnospiraceae bacterium]|nr:MBL fold metallo-hydrolase [Lachnospiraceae bacterium]